MTDTSQTPTGHPADKTMSEDLRERGSDMASAAREKAGEYAGMARERAHEYGEDAKNTAADETSKVAAALRKASEDLRHGSPQERVFGRMADGLADAADGLRRMDVDEIGHEVSDFARRNPAAFLGGMALAGFAAARFLKSSARSGHEYDSHAGAPDRPYGGYEPAGGYAKTGATTGATAGAAGRKSAGGYGAASGAASGTGGSSYRPGATGSAGSTGSTSGYGSTSGTGGTGTPGTGSYGSGSATRPTGTTGGTSTTTGTSSSGSATAPRDEHKPGGNN